MGFENPSNRPSSKWDTLYNRTVPCRHGPKLAAFPVVITQFLVSLESAPESRQIWMLLFGWVSIALCLSAVTTGLVLTQIMESEWRVSNNRPSTLWRVLTIHCEFSVPYRQFPNVEFYKGIYALTEVHIFWPSHK